MNNIPKKKTFSGSHMRGVGDGYLDFKCDSCGAICPVMRSRAVPLDGPGRPPVENTARFVSACVGIGIGYEQATNLALGLNIGPLCKSTWEGCQAKCAASVRTALDKEIEVSIKEEIMLTQLFEGDAAIDKATGETMIRVIADGSWQKRYGRNSLWGYSAMYGFYSPGHFRERDCKGRTIRACAARVSCLGVSGMAVGFLFEGQTARGIKLPRPARFARQHSNTRHKPR